MFEGVVATLLNRFLGNYVTNLETTQLKLGIWQGDVKLEKLRLKQDALDKLRLPVDIKEGWLGTLTISIPWSNLKGEPVRIHIDDVYVLATPRFQENFDPEREEEREYKRKMRRLDNDDTLRLQKLSKNKAVSSDEKKQASFTEQLIAKIVDNLQIVIKNIHVRYEDHISNPNHMFAVGTTLGELSAVSTDEEWRPAFLHDSGSVIRKMLRLAHFSMYWDTECKSMQGLDHESFIRQFAQAIDPANRLQPILQPVAGMGKLTMNKRPSPEDVRTMAKFEFDQLAFEMDNDQYADALLLTASFDYAMRQRRYRKHRPPPGIRPKDNPRAWLLFAINSVYDEVHDHNHRKTWEFQKERRDDRLLYIRIYTMFKVNNGVLTGTDATALELLHRKLSYQDIRFYRARAEPSIRKQQYLIKKHRNEVEKASGGHAASSSAAAGGNAGSGGITGWVGGWVSSWVTGAPSTQSQNTQQQKQQQGQQSASSPNEKDSSIFADNDEENMQLSEKQMQELYDTIEFNEEDVDDVDYDLPKETIKLAMTAILRSGSLRLKTDRKTRDHTLMGLLFNGLKIDFLQRPQNIVADVSMHGFEVVDGTLPGTRYPRMIYVQSDDDGSASPTADRGGGGGGDEATGDDGKPVKKCLNKTMPTVSDSAEASGQQAALTFLEDKSVKGSSSAPDGEDTGDSSSSIRGHQDPFLQVHFEKDPLDGHADSVVNVKVKSLNVIYHPTAARAIMDFLEPPSSASAQSVHALIAAASKSVAGLRDQTRAGLEYALQKHKTLDVKVDFDAPVIVIPQDILDPNSQVVVLDTGYLTIESQLVDSATSERIRQKQNQVLSAEEMKDLESLMYDHFDMKLHSTQLLVGANLDSCMRALQDGVSDTRLHVVDRIELNFDLGLCILSEPPLHMPKVTVDGSLPSLQVYFSDRKYKAIMGCIDLILEAIQDDDVDIAQQYETGNPQTAFGAGGVFINGPDKDATEEPDPGMLLTAEQAGEDTSGGSDDNNRDDTQSIAGSTDEFYETNDQVDENQGDVGRLRRKDNKDARMNVGKEPERALVKVNFAVDNLVGFIWRTHTDGRDDLHIADIAVTGLAVECINRPFDLFANVTIHQVTIEDHLLHSGSNNPSRGPVFALTSDIAQADANGETDKNLVAVKYHRCQADHPEFTTTYESIGQTVEVDISYLNLMVVRKTILTSYDYILKTFTDENSSQQASLASKQQQQQQQPKDSTGLESSSVTRDDGNHSPEDKAAHEQASSTTAPSEEMDTSIESLIQRALDTIRVDIRFKGTDFSLCHDDGSPIALLSVTAATTRVIVTKEILVEAKVGNIKLADQLDLAPVAKEDYDPRRLLLYIKSDELADLRYETFNPQSLNYPGHNAAVKLRLGAAHLMFMERPIRELMLFGSRFSAMHGLFEAARQAAAYGTTQLTEEMMGGTQKYHFDVIMSAPVIGFPRDGIVPYDTTTGDDHKTVDMLVAQPGELTISNEFTTVREMGRDWDVNHISLTLRRIGIKTVFVFDDDTSDNTAFGQPGEQVLQILEDVDYNMDMHILMQGHIPGCPRPVTELIGMLSPIKMKLTEYQYKMVYDLLGVIGRVFGSDPNAPVEPDPLISDKLLDLSILRENPATKEAQSTRQALVNLGQISQAGSSLGELGQSEEESAGQYANIDLFVTLATIQLELFKGSGFNLDRIQKASFTRMDINDLSVKYRSKANGDSKAEIAILAVRAYDTRHSTENQFTQIISPTITTQRSDSGSASVSVSGSAGENNPHHMSMHAMAQDTPVEEDSSSPQLVCHVDMRPNQDMVVLVTLDSPRIILVLDHAFMLMGFATSVFPPPDQQQQQQQGAISSPKPQQPNNSAPDNSNNNSTGSLIYKVDVVHPEIILLANPQSRSSEALILSINQIVLAQEGMFCATMDEIGVSLCNIDRRQETSRNVMDPFTIITTMDARQVPGDPRRGTQPSQVSDISVDVGNLLLRLGINDVILMLDIFNTAMELFYKKDENQEHQLPAKQTSQGVVPCNENHRSNAEHTSSCRSLSPDATTSGSPSQSTGGFSRSASVASATQTTKGSSVRADGKQGTTAKRQSSSMAHIVKETMRATVASLRIVVIRDMFGLPVYACTAKEFHVDITDWSVSMRVQSNLQLQMSYFNRRNSHWEPFIEPWGFTLNVANSTSDADPDDDHVTQKIDVSSTDRLLVNASHAFIEETLGLVAQWGDEMEKHQKRQAEGNRPVGERMPYVLINRTGIDCHVWVDLPEGTTARTERIDTTPVLLRDGESLPWRFEDWRRRREQLEVKSHHLGIQFANGQWEWLRRVQVDREGTKHYLLLPAVDDIQHRLAVEVKLDAVNLVKRVVLRSPLVVENQTRVAMEVAMCDYRGELRTDSAVIQPGEELPLPIMFCHQYAVRVRPESGFGYAWSSQYVFWRDFLAQEARPELCCLPQAAAHALQRRGAAGARSSADSDVIPFFVHFNALCDMRNPALYKYPFMRLVMTPPMEIENLLPYPLDLCVLDKTANRRWISPLERGGVAPVHAVQPGHLVLLTIRIPEAGFDKCKGSIIETSDEDEYPVEEELVMTDNQGINLALKLHRMDIPNSGGRCRRISIYAPYVMVNRTGLKLFYSSKGFFKGVTAVAGQNVNSNQPQGPSIAGGRSSNPPNEFVRHPTSLGAAIGGRVRDDIGSRPLMFSFGSYDLRNRALVRVSDSDWSRPLSFDALGSSSEFVIPSNNKLADTHLGIEIEPGRGRYSHTRVVTFTSRYVVKNMTGLTLQYRTVYNMTSSELLRDGERQPLHTLHRARRRLLTIAEARINSMGEPVASVQDGRWSSPFSIDDIGRVFVRLNVKPKDRGPTAEEEVLVKIDIIMEGACLFVILQKEDKYWPYQIENNTPTDVVVWQYLEKHQKSAEGAVLAGSGNNNQLAHDPPALARSSNAQLSPSPSPPPQQTSSSVSGVNERHYVVRAGESLNYAWDLPTAQNKLLVISAQGSTRRISLQEIGEQRPFIYGKPTLPPRRGTGSSGLSATAAAALANREIAECTMNIEVVAAGPKQILRLTGYAAETSLYAPQLQAIQSPVMTRSNTQQTAATGSTTRRGTSDERFEVVDSNERTNSVFRLALEGGIGVSLINKYSSEILFATLADVELKYTDSTSNQTFKLTVKWIQIDNQIYGALYPIVLYPTTLGVAMAGVSAPPALQAVAVRAKDGSYGVEYFKYASVLAQELSVELDEDFLYALLDFVKFDVPGWTSSTHEADEETTGTNMLHSDIPEVKAFEEGQQLYFEFLHIQPFKLNISFMRTQRLDVGGDPTAARYPAVASAAAAAAAAGGGKTNSPLGPLGAAAGGSGGGMTGLGSEQTGEGVASTPGIVAYAMNVLTMAIGNINEAPVFLNALVMQNVRVSLPVLIDRMRTHYSQEVFNQVYKVVGSANFLGNPVGLFNNISSGVSDFFYEPYQGFVMSDRPQDFGVGLARGTASLFKKTVFGMTDSFSKFTDSMSKGLSAATMDPRYQTERSMSRVRNKPKHAIYGVARGAESFAKSVSSGLAGVVMRPLEGAEQEGVGGFFKGVGKGLVGVVTKPVIGMFDLASNVTEGIRNTTTVFERDLDRQRLPRHINRDGIITVYSGREALGQAWMRELSKGAYALDSYLAHLELPGSDMVVLLTYQRLVMFRRAKPDEAGMVVGAAGSSAETGNATGAIGVSAANASKAQVEWEQEIKSLHSIQLEATGISLKLPPTSEGYVPPGPFIPIADAQSRRWFYDQIREAVKALIDQRKELG